MSSDNSPSIEKPWFQDTKTGCEKQAHYFLQIRKLQEELIHREQHNLINAMERLKQLTYPRKRPIIRNIDTSDQLSPQSFPARNINLRKVLKHKALQGKEKPELSPVSGKPLIRKPVHNGPENYHRFFVMPPVLSDKDIAKIVHHAKTTFPSEPSTYLLQPHLPSIPIVGRKTNFMKDNRLKLLTLAEPEFCDTDRGSVTGTSKHLHTGKSRQRKRSPTKSSLQLEGNTSKENLRKRTGNVLTFDVDPDDPSLFSHCMSYTKKGDGQYETSPLPPPNSRPSSTKSKSSQVQLEITTKDGDTKEEVSKHSTKSNKESEVMNSSTGHNTANKFSEDNQVAEKVEKTDSRLEGGSADISVLGDQISVQKDQISSSLPGKRGQDDSEDISENQEQVEVAQPVVTIISKPPDDAVQET